MLRYNLGVDLEDGEHHDVVADARDLRAWERTNDRTALGEKVSVSFLTDIAYTAGVRAGLWNSTREAFETRCISIEVNGNSEETPTRRGRGRRSSSPSPSAQASQSASGSETPEQS